MVPAHYIILFILVLFVSDGCLIYGQEWHTGSFIRMNITARNNFGVTLQPLSHEHFVAFWNTTQERLMHYQFFKPSVIGYESAMDVITATGVWSTTPITERISKDGVDYVAIASSPVIIVGYDKTKVKSKQLQLESTELVTSILPKEDLFLVGSCDNSKNTYHVRHVHVDGSILIHRNISIREDCTKFKLAYDFLFAEDSQHGQYSIVYFNGSSITKKLAHYYLPFELFPAKDALVYAEKQAVSDTTTLIVSKIFSNGTTLQIASLPRCKYLSYTFKDTVLTVACFYLDSYFQLSVVYFDGTPPELSFRSFASIGIVPYRISPTIITMFGCGGPIGCDIDAFNFAEVDQQSLNSVSMLGTLENSPAVFKYGYELLKFTSLRAKELAWTKRGVWFLTEMYVQSVTINNINYLGRNLSNYSLVGPISVLALVSSPSLESIDLSNNRLYGNISAVKFNSPNLSVLNLSHNTLTGCPQRFPQNLTKCDLRHNMLGLDQKCDVPICDLRHQHYLLQHLEPSRSIPWYTTHFKSPKNRDNMSRLYWRDLIVFAGGFEDTAVEFFNTTSGEWGVLGNLYQGRLYSSMAAVGPYLVISGGMLHDRPTATVDIYNSLNNTWSISHMELPRIFHSAATVGDEVWHGAGEFVEAFNPATQKWRSLSKNMTGNIVVTPYAVVSSDGKIYDRVNEKWSSFKTPLNSMVIAFGSNVAVIPPLARQIQVLDTYGWIWTTIPFSGSMNVFCGASSNNHLVLLATVDNVVSPQLMMFNLSSKNWSNHSFPLYNNTAYQTCTAFANDKRQVWFVSNSIIALTFKGLIPAHPPTTAPIDLAPQIVPVDSPTVIPSPNKAPDSTIPSTVPTSDHMAPIVQESSHVWIAVIIVVTLAGAAVAILLLWLRGRRVRKFSLEQEDEVALLTTSDRELDLHEDVKSSPSDIPFNELLIGEKLGEGGHGEVYKAKWHGQSVVVKRVKSNKLDQTALLEEARTLISLHHKHIVLSMGVSKNEKTNDVLLVMEYMKNGSLEDLLFKDQISLTRQEIASLALDIAKGLNYLHSLNPKIVHRDLKAANVLLYQNRRRAKISDFGTARLLNTSSAASTVIGTFGFMAPEILQEAPYNEKADIYSFGVLLFELVSNTHMPIIFEEEKRIEKIDGAVHDPELKQLIINCCRTDPIERPSIRRCIEILKQVKAK